MPRQKYGLGIDAGGTYTDLVVFDLPAGQVVKKAKSLTTNWDFTVGIELSLDEIGDDLLTQCELVSLSTTLATNAIVEKRGQKVGLLLMPPFGLFSADGIQHTPAEIIKGRLDSDGIELEPLDPDEISLKARSMVRAHHVKAFAVSGFAGCHNPTNELEAARIIREETSLPVVCGYQLSGLLNYKIRAQTAVLNAQIIPCLEDFLNNLSIIFKKRRINAPVMIVKSDGSLMKMEKAIQRPVETILSGPAASVAGAAYLTGCKDCMVVDVGGTTTDYAIIRNGSARLSEEGARVGGWKTHVRSLDLRTIGLGGDSLIFPEGESFRIGPTRVLPVSRLVSQCPESLEAFEYLERYISQRGDRCGGLEIFMLNEKKPNIDLSGRESMVIGMLTERPRSLREMSVIAGQSGWQFLPLSRLEESNVVQRCGLTPTDLLHISGHMDRWNKEGPRRMCQVMSKALDIPFDEFVQNALKMVIDRITTELVKTELAAELDPEDLEGSKAASTLIQNMLQQGNADFRVRFELKKPVIGIGAPAWFFLPKAAGFVETDCLVPPHADVANAIGAIISPVIINREVRIVQSSPGCYIIQGLPDAPRYEDIGKAERFAVEELRRIVLQEAREWGTDCRDPDIVINDSSFSAPGEIEEFLYRNIRISISGKPSASPLDTGGASP